MWLISWRLLQIRKESFLRVGMFKYKVKSFGMLYVSGKIAGSWILITSKTYFHDDYLPAQNLSSLISTTQNIQITHSLIFQLTHMTPNSFTPPSSSSSFSSQEIPQSSLMPSSLKSKGTQRYTSAPNLLVWLEGTLFWASFHVQSVIGVSTNLNPAPEGCFVFWKAQTPDSPTFFRWAWLVSTVPTLKLFSKETHST